MKKFAVILAGCGHRDGAEITEAVTLLLAIDQQECSYQCFAPDVMQHDVVNHYTQKVTPDEQRNVLVEAARIARGNIKPLSEFNADEFDALAFAGGFGAAKNLCTFATEGSNLTINAEVERAIKLMHQAHKPIGAMCIAPIILAKIIPGVHLTLGSDSNDAAQVARQLKAQTIQTENGDVVIDNDELVFTTPCYMLQASVADIYDGASNMVEAMIESIK